MTPVAKTKKGLPKTERRKDPLGSAVKTALERYLRDLDGHSPDNLYQMVIDEIEQPMLEIVMRHVGGNQSKAAELLGINRGTLRKKLAQHHID
jgi:Fis family transcriptional regulator